MWMVWAVAAMVAVLDLDADADGDVNVDWVRDGEVDRCDICSNTREDIRLGLNHRLVRDKGNIRKAGVTVCGSHRREGTV